jgi:hypothetical protein
MVFLLLMTITGMLTKAIITLGARAATKLQQRIAEPKAEGASLLKIKVMADVATIKGLMLETVAINQKLPASSEI